MSYLLRFTLKHVYVKCGNRSSIRNTESPAVCKLCSTPLLSQARLQTNCEQRNPEKAKVKPKSSRKKSGSYSDVIKVANSCGARVTEERTVIKKPPTNDFLKRMGVNVSEAPSSLSEHFDTAQLASTFDRRNKNSDVYNTYDDYSEPAMSFSSGTDAVEEAEDSESISDLSNLPKIQNKSKAPNLKKIDRNKLFKVEQKTIEEQSRGILFGSSLQSSLDVSLSCNMLIEAKNMLLYYANNDKSYLHTSMPKDDVMSLFNMVMMAAGEQGNLNCIKELMTSMRAMGLTPNLRAYAAFLICVARCPDITSGLIPNLINDIAADCLNLADIYKESSFYADQRNDILKAIRTVLPEFHLDCHRVPETYISILLSPLNKKVSQDSTNNLSGHQFDSRFAGEQLSMEVAGDVVLKSIVQVSPKSSKKRLFLKKLLDEYRVEWRKVLLESYKMNLKNLLKQFHVRTNENGIALHPFLSVLDPSEYVDIMIEEIRRLADSSESFSMPRSFLHYTIGSRVLIKYLIKVKQQRGTVDKIEMVYDKYCQYYVDPILTREYLPRQYWQKLCREHLDCQAIGEQDIWWPNHIITRVGKFLYDILIINTKINDNLYKKEGNNLRTMPAFNSIYRTYGIKTIMEIKPHPVLIKLFQNLTEENLTFPANELPMLSPPLPWVSSEFGGYLLTSAKLVRISNSVAQQNRLIKSLPANQLFPVYDSLNSLGECAWIINKPILDIIIDLFNNNGDEKLEIPPPASLCPPLPQITSEMSNLEMAKVYQQRKKIKQMKGDMHSLWCDALYKLSIANHYRDNIFWFPHNLDFRGRVYPVPPRFNHLGNDVSRGVLLFADGKPLGENGLNWLKIQTINLSGLKKREPITERLRFANEIMDEIFDSADRPMTGNKWWQNADEPWQTLACCREVANAVRSSDPTKYVCHLPIQQDGSCNGLQHYAALGRDQEGAERVNLCAFNKPQDVYSGVAELVEKERIKDASEGREIARILEGFVTRKVIKQTVMTTVYGVTRYGARLQIARQLKDLSDFPQEKVFTAANYLSMKTFISLKQMFGSAKEIQDWFTDCARQISQVCGQSVTWVTPLGLPVVQPYMKIKKTSMNIKIGDKNDALHCNIIEKPNVIKQRNAFAPNFIHSLDSTHMMLTALYCRRAGLTFVAVHDCFWTHPSTVELMNKICRKQFLSLHNGPILEDLSSHFFKNFSYSQMELSEDGSLIGDVKRMLNDTLLSVPQKGTFNLENVLDSTYFFS